MSQAKLNFRLALLLLGTASAGFTQAVTYVQNFSGNLWHLVPIGGPFKAWISIGPKGQPLGPKRLLQHPCPDSGQGFPLVPVPAGAILQIDLAEEGVAACEARFSLADQFLENPQFAIMKCSWRPGLKDAHSPLAGAAGSGYMPGIWSQSGNGDVVFQIVLNDYSGLAIPALVMEPSSHRSVQGPPIHPIANDPGAASLLDLGHAQASSAAHGQVPTAVAADSYGVSSGQDAPLPPLPTPRTPPPFGRRAEGGNAMFTLSPFSFSPRTHFGSGFSGAASATGSGSPLGGAGTKRKLNLDMDEEDGNGDFKRSRHDASLESDPTVLNLVNLGQTNWTVRVELGFAEQVPGANGVLAAAQPSGFSSASPTYTVFPGQTLFLKGTGLDFAEVGFELLGTKLPHACTWQVNFTSAAGGGYQYSLSQDRPLEAHAEWQWDRANRIELH